VTVGVSVDAEVGVYVGVDVRVGVGVCVAVSVLVAGGELSVLDGVIGPGVCAPSDSAG
jgi:hypothetical protein